jgi:hypothetical protein
VSCAPCIILRSVLALLNEVCRTEAETSRVMDSGVLGKTYAMFDHQDPYLRSDACARGLATSLSKGEAFGLLRLGIEWS